MILPAVFVFSGGDANVLNSGSSLLFITMPQVFMSMPFGQAVGAVFFILVFFAALTSAISFVRNHCFRISGSIWVEANPYLHRYLFWSHCNWFGCCLGIWLVEWSYYIWNEHLRFSGLFTNSILMPISALFTCIFLGFIVGTSVVADEVKLSSRFRSEKCLLLLPNGLHLYVL